MTITLIIAVSTNNAIGNNNQLLWHLPNDLKFFKNTTWGFPVIMGRKTFESVNKPLPGRINIVITANPDWKMDGVITASGLQDAIDKAISTNCKEIFIIGGGEIYRQSIGIADKIYLTQVHATIEGDTFFPVLDEKNWELVFNEDFKENKKHMYDYSFQTWMHKNPVKPSLSVIK